MADRTRNWALILYPEELPEDYESLILGLNIPSALSPLHDPDAFNINVEEQRKKHRHLFLAYDGVKTKENVIEDVKSALGSCKGWAKPIKVASPKAMVRYFIHADQPEKQQFKDRFLSIQCYNGFTLDNFLVPSSSEKSMYINEMMDFIEDNDITEIEDLFNIARANYYDTWFYCLNNTSLQVIKAFISSKRHRAIELAYNSKRV